MEKRAFHSRAGVCDDKRGNMERLRHIQGVATFRQSLPQNVLIPPITPERSQTREPQNLQIKRKTDIKNVPAIQRALFLRRHELATVHLRPACETGGA